MATNSTQNAPSEPTGEDLLLEQVVVGDMDNNSYLLHDGEKALLIDAADDAATLLQLAESTGVRITDVLTTHRHPDHVGALPEILEKTGAKHHTTWFDAPAMPEGVRVDSELRQGDVLEFAGRELPINVLRGHTPGGACLTARVDGRLHLFVGDSLFPDGLGKTNSESDFIRLFRDVTGRIFDVYGDDVVVDPGHGKSTTLGEERGKLDDWWERRW